MLKIPVRPFIAGRIGHIINKRNAVISNTSTEWKYRTERRKREDAF